MCIRMSGFFLSDKGILLFAVRIHKLPGQLIGIIGLIPVIFGIVK